MEQSSKIIGFVIKKEKLGVECLVLLDQETSYFQTRIFNLCHESMFFEIEVGQFFTWSTFYDNFGLTYNVEKYYPTEKEFQLFLKNSNNFKF